MHLKTNIILCLFVILHAALEARVLDIQITQCDTILEGKNWGTIGPYELCRGKVVFGTDPFLAVNQKITDIEFAPVNEDGLVESTSDIVILKPIDQDKSTLGLIEISNRGGKFTPSYFLQGQGRLENTDMATSFGDGLLLEKGITIIWVGWQFDVPEGEHLMNFFTPTAKYPEGSPIIGLARSDWTLDEATHNLKLGHRDQAGYAVYDPASSLHQLTVRDGREDPRTIVDRSQWSFGKWVDGVVTEHLNWIHAKDKFAPGKIYELVYYAKDPPLVGLGLAAIRDIAAYVKYDSTCTFKVRKTVAVGVSQTGRFLRHFLYQGFNKTEFDQTAFDGMMIITAGAGRGSFNHRFAQPSRDGHRYSAFFYPTDLFPFTGKDQTDTHLKKTDGLLSHLTIQHQPKIMYLNTGYEYYGRAASLIHTNLEGTQDVLPAENERIYHIASGQHFVDQFPPSTDSIDVHIGNPLQFKPNYRALLMALNSWVLADIPPPASNYPLISRSDLVKPSELKYPELVDFIPSKVSHTAYRADYGSDWGKGIITNQPPNLGEPYPSLVPQVDQYGNEKSGIRNFEITVPLATYIPYSLRTHQTRSQEEIADFRGTYIPFSIDKNRDRKTPGIQDLYSSKNNYLTAVRRELDLLAAQRFILRRDIHFLMDRASTYWNWIHRDVPLKSSNDVGVMTFNIRWDNPDDGISNWAFRKDQVADIIMNYSPDFLGLQEALENQCKDVNRNIKGYKWIGIGRDDGNKEGEYAPIFYQHKKWKLIDWSYFWLSETPTEPSLGWDAQIKRIVTWAQFKNRKNGKIIFVFNTHFDHRGQIARRESSKLLKQQISQLANGKPFTVMGDLNFGAASENYLLLSDLNEQILMDTKQLSSTQPKGPEGTFSGFTVKENMPLHRIDHIFVGPKMRASHFEVINQSQGGFYASDHFAVYTRIGF